MSARSKVDRRLNIAGLVLGVVAVVPAIVNFFRGHHGTAFVFLGAAVLLAVLLLAIRRFVLNLVSEETVEVAASAPESLSLLEKKVYPLIHWHLEKDKTRTVHIYEANLETSDPFTVLDEDVALAKKDGRDPDNPGKPRFVHWKSVILRSTSKEAWIAKWLNSVKAPNQHCEVKFLNGENISWPLVNFFVVQELNLFFMGFGHYDKLGVEGGILVRSKKATVRLISLIDGLMKEGSDT
jgi:hypothetical protein